MIIAVDFDGTCVTHDFPRVGRDIGAVPVLKKILENGHKIILWTIRSDGQVKGDVLTDAIKWFKDNDIELYGVNKHPTQKVWSSSPKAYAEMYIDDAALGCPVVTQPLISERPYVDWPFLEVLLKVKGVIK